ncbi:MAG TPA: hypothetical protein VEG30_17880 [Terriglobales bacterium]|nr:hypothetical protein [Terriglobales bacterium]
MSGINSRLAALSLLVVIFSHLPTESAAQTTNDVYHLNYYSNRYNPYGLDQRLRIINPGEQGTPMSANHGTVCADIYVFDARQEMIECCACRITANGMLELSVNLALTSNPLTGYPPPNDGVIKVISDSHDNCAETGPVPTPDLRLWLTHLQSPDGKTLVMTESDFQQAPLQENELSFLGLACTFVQYLGSGRGVCACGPHGS